MTRRHLRPLAALALVASAAFLIGSCGSSGAAGGDADPNGAASAGSTKHDARAQAVKFSECVREHGVRDFPDPNADNDFDYGISVSPEVWTAAVEACKEYQPPGTLSADRDPQQQSAALEFAKCMREQGVKDFPDPIDGEPLVDTNRIPSSNVEGGMTILNAAMEQCGDLTEKALSK